jgi:hypothetical protein
MAELLNRYYNGGFNFSVCRQIANAMTLVACKLDKDIEIFLGNVVNYT